MLILATGDAISVFMAEPVQSQVLTLNRPKKAVSGLPDPCGLRDVLCSGENDENDENDPKPVRIIISTVTNYQAVIGQTDSSPCSGAMAGVDFCNPPYPIVANNCLKLGTKVSILGVIYTVADRMNPRYGCNIFDRLTTERGNLYNYPVTVLSSDH